MMAASGLKRLTVVERTADRLIMKNYKGAVRTFHRCPVGTLKAPSGAGEH